MTFECLFVQLHYTRSFNFTNQSIIKYILLKESVIAQFFTIDNSCLKLADVYYVHIRKGGKLLEQIYLENYSYACAGKYEKCHRFTAKIAACCLRAIRRACASASGGTYQTVTYSNCKQLYAWIIGAFFVIHLSFSSLLL